MNIVHVSTSDQRGAFEAATRLHYAFLEAGHRSFMVVRNKTVAHDSIIECNSPFQKKKQRLFEWVEKMVFHKHPDYYFFNASGIVSLVNSDSLYRLLPCIPDVIIFHWTSKFITTRVMYELKKRTNAVIFWHLLDMAAMTGGCHYAWNCTGYTAACGRCPALYSQSPFDGSSVNFAIKNYFIKKIHPVIIAPTRELYDQCKQSSLLKNLDIHKILLPLDTNIFQPGNVSMLRRKHRIPLHATVLCFRSDLINQKRKGIQYIFEALSCLEKKGLSAIHLAILGSMKENERERLPFPYTVFSNIQQAEDLAQIYSLSDVFLSGSIEDSGPMMVNEAIACGLPVIAFPIGVARDLIIPNNSGFIVPLKNATAMAEKILVMHRMPSQQRLQMRVFCRDLGLKKLSYRAVIKQYEKYLQNVA